MSDRASSDLKKSGVSTAGVSQSAVSAERLSPRAPRRLEQSGEAILTRPAADAATNRQRLDDRLVTEYLASLTGTPQDKELAQQLAWILSTHEDASYRDGELALRIAATLVECEHVPDPASLTSLAAAYAEVGQFEAAQVSLERAESSAGLAEDPERKVARRMWRAMLKSHLPIRENPPAVVRGRSPPQPDSLARLAAAQVIVAKYRLRDGGESSARGLLERAIEFDPHCKDAHFALAELKARSGKLDEAQRHLALALESSTSQVQNRAGTRVGESGVESSETRVAVATDPASIAFLGFLKVQRGDARAGIELYENALSLRPEWPELANDLAWLLATHTSPAVRNAKRAISLAESFADKAGDPRRLDTLAAAYASDNRFVEAQRAERRAIELAREQSADVQTFEENLRLFEAGIPLHRRTEFSIERGDAAIAQKDWNAAAEHYSRAVREQPDNAAILARLGMIRLQQGRNAEGVRLYHAATLLRPAWWPSLANDLAWIFATHRDPDLRDPAVALQMAHQLCEQTERRNWRYLDTLACAAAASSRFEEAIKITREAMAIDDEARTAEEFTALGDRLELYQVERPYLDDCQMHVDLAELATVRGNLSAAARQYHAALTIKPHDPDMLARLAAICERQGDIAQAISVYRQALAARPSWPALSNDLAWLLATTADDALARPAEAIERITDVLRHARNEATYLDTLAAAQARAGLFDDALTTALDAERLAREQDRNEMAVAIHDRLELYRAHRSYRAPR